MMCPDAFISLYYMYKYIIFAFYNFVQKVTYVVCYFKAAMNLNMMMSTTTTYSYILPHITFSSHL